MHREATGQQGLMGRLGWWFFFRVDGRWRQEEKLEIGFEFEKHFPFDHREGENIPRALQCSIEPGVHEWTTY